MLSPLLANDSDYLPPEGYYESATGTGEMLETRLKAIMSKDHILRTYGDLRYSAAITDRDPARPANIILVYSRDSVSAAWDSGQTWNREHLWPSSRIPGPSPTNGTVGVKADPLMLRPCDPTVNAHRGNSPFGTETSSGDFGYDGSYWFPGEEDKGDVARALFYTETRWSGEGIALVDGYPGANQMGDLSALLKWHYEDVPDTFERRRNQAVYSSGLNPQYYTNNRNAYIDRPEYVWSVFVDNENDTQLTTDYSLVNLGRVIVGQSLPSQTIDIIKSGQDGTYFEVRSTGDATSDITGRYNAFAMGGPETRPIEIGLSGSTQIPGLKFGTVVIDNLDVTTGGGPGKGANDSDDVITVLASVVSHANGSFSEENDVDTLTIDFGTVFSGSGTASCDFSLWNLETVSNFTAGLDLDSVSLLAGNGDALSTNLAPSSSLGGGKSVSFQAFLDTSEAGSFSATYRLNLSDEAIPGAETQFLTLQLTGNVILGGDLNGDGCIGSRDLDTVRSFWGARVPPGDVGQGDASGDGIVGSADLDLVRAYWGTGPDDLKAPEAVPEPIGPILMTGLLFPSLAATKPQLTFGPVRSTITCFLNPNPRAKLFDPVFARSVNELSERPRSAALAGDCQRNRPATERPRNDCERKLHVARGDASLRKRPDEQIR